jgi:hypothetical protein
MALTRVTSTVLESNAVSAEKMANGSIVTRLYGIKSIEAKHLAASANTSVLTTSINVLQDNINVVHANVVAAQANIISANTAVFNAAKSNDFVTFTAAESRINATTNNVNTVSANVTSVETRRVANIAGAVSTITTADLTASRALVSSGSGKVAISDVTSTELGYVDGVTSAIQTQLNAGVTNTNTVHANVVAAEANIAGVLAGTKNFTGGVTMGDDLIIQGNLTVLGDSVTANTINAVIQDRFLFLANSVSGASAADVGILMNRGNDGNAAIYYDESTFSFTMAETRDPDSNVIISPTGLANLVVGTLKYNGADLNTAITDNRSGAVSTVYKDNLTASRALASDGSGKIVISDVTSTELGYLDGVTSAIQTQLTAGVSNAAAVVTEAVGIEARRAANIAGAVSTITTGNLTASRALVSDASGKVAALASVTSTELAFLDATSSIQTQLDTKGSTAGFEANDFITFQRLNANINIVSANVALGLKQLINVAASATGEGTGSNNFFVATPPGANPVAINNVIVTLNGITQTKTTDYIYTPASGKVTFTDAAIPSGLTVQIVTLNPPA